MTDLYRQSIGVCGKNSLSIERTHMANTKLQINDGRPTIVQSSCRYVDQIVVSVFDYRGKPLAMYDCIDRLDLDEMLLGPLRLYCEGTIVDSSRDCLKVTIALAHTVRLNQSNIDTFLARVAQLVTRGLVDCGLTVEYGPWVDQQEWVEPEDFFALGEDEWLDA